jgi:8-oxo-dGTP pyrophosphatase MutT (NUDIX family)
MMKKNKIRPLAICVFWHDGRILAAKGYDKVKKQIFYRPLGGAIEFGESSAETIARELKEEINARVKGLSYLGTLENIFTFNGDDGHEIVMIYNGTFVDKSLYKRDSIEGHEDNDDSPLFTAYWMKLDDFRGKDAPRLYPKGLLELLETEFSSVGSIVRGGRRRNSRKMSE